MTTEQFLAEVKERLEKATPGKWESRCIQKQIYPGHWALYGGGTDAVFIDDPWDWTQKDRPEIKQVCADADLIANAPTDLARLVKMVEMLHECMAMIASAEVLGQVKSELAQEALILCDRIAGAGSGEMKGMQAEDIPNELILNWLAEHQGKWSFAAIIQADKGRIDSYNTYAKLYGTWTPTFWNGYQLASSGRPSAPMRERLTYNIVQSCIDTLTARISQNKPKPLFLTSACNQNWHDAFGKNYEDCSQCFVRDNGPWPDNPLLQASLKIEKKWWQFWKK